MPRIPLPEDPSYYCSPIHAWVSPLVSFSQVSPPQHCTHLSSPYNCYILRQFFHLDFITQTILGGQCRSLSSSLCSFLHYPVTLFLKHPQRPILKHPQLMFLLKCVRPCFTPIKNNRQNYSSVCLNLSICGQHTAPNDSKHSLTSN